MGISKQGEQIVLQQLFTRLEEHLLGKQAMIHQFITVLLAGGHLLLEDIPGVGKTMLVHTFAEAIGGQFKRIQFTNDTMPTDVTGGLTLTGEGYALGFRPGPIMANIVLADEINRAMSRTQSALLEAMEERTVTVDGRTYALPQPFMLIATQNPLHMEGTNRLPEAQLDRFMAKLSIGYPAEEDEKRMLQKLVAGDQKYSFKDDGKNMSITNIETWSAMQQAVSQIYVEHSLLQRMVKVVHQTRHHKDTILGVSPRGSRDWLKVAQANAYVAGRAYVIPEDIVETATYVLPHRLQMHSGVSRSNASVTAASTAPDKIAYIKQLLQEQFASVYWPKGNAR
ncbi:AAA family ATPase [Paenibacillus yanchengensis]|uniref:AAA family ATPase n=1 Tax=Paenibacillus yanchengensis TaxID=2035833 RepID=A0ABW4YID2_9BACL